MASYTQLVDTKEDLEAFTYNSEQHIKRVFTGKNPDRSIPTHQSAIALKEALHFFNTQFSSYACNGRAFLIFEALTCNDTAARMQLHESNTHDCVPIKAPALRDPDTGKFTGKTLLSILWIATKFELGGSAPSARRFIVHCALCAEMCPQINDWPSCTMTLLSHESYVFSLTCWALSCSHLHDIAGAYIWAITAVSLKDACSEKCDLHEKVRSELQPFNHLLLQKCDEWIVFSYSQERNKLGHCTLADIAHSVVEEILPLYPKCNNMTKDPKAFPALI